MWFSGAASAGGPNPVVGLPTVGWNRQYLVGRWTPVVVPVTVYDSSSIQLELTAVDPDGNRVSFLSPPVDLNPGEHQLEGLIKVGCLDGEVRVRIDRETALQGIPGRSDWLKFPLKSSTRLVVTVGEPRGFDFETDSALPGQSVKIAAMKATELPTNPLAYDGVSSLVLAGSIELSSAQSNAIRDWVNSGGRLVISLPQDVTAARRSIQPSVEWLPVRLAEQPVVVREFGGLEAFSGKNIRIPQKETLSIPSLQLESGVVLAASRTESFLVRAPYGMGAVTVLALDLTATPLSEWKSLSPFCARLTEVGLGTDGSDKGSNRGSQLSSTGITDLATQLHAIQEHFDRVNRASPWFVMGLLLALLVVVGPLDYLIVHRIFKRPHLTWVTFPLLATVSAVLASSLATASNGVSRRANQLDIINVDVATATARGRHFVTIYSPSTSQSSIDIEPLPLVSEPITPSTSRVIWHGVPESTFGGMLRETGLQQGAKYEQQPGGELTQLPVMQWSTKALVCESAHSVDGLIECNLRASATGSLSGTILHRFSSPIEDWMLVYQNRVYRQLKSREDLKTLPLPPKQIWRVEQPGVFQRELRPFLTGIVTMATPRFGQESTSELVHQQTSYDQMSLDPSNLVRTLTFHNEVGGERYTGLTNNVLNGEDCSHLLKLDRAILFGRLSQPLATIEQDRQPLEPDRQTSFVRLILPVVRSGELLKDLRRLVPD